MNPGYNQAATEYLCGKTRYGKKRFMYLQAHVYVCVDMVSLEGLEQNTKRILFIL